ncbi:SusC/RagA family TonB-linked outer membrane protein [Plebeiibacterium sediminum]|uniref:SusC/RagA family TonB-linked outer membrane protein n=1 Tax=Plebeiibacterium sediminum TaxID=2992112 RepID=A0AAE3M1R1_9BACT|nr:SusC/RagA family TonB-linked outer membrane protein [Plebeiobacterium sediminum]MCW3785247.1 SusC/RagA family TonB-linked outer membrane protein [Plebeiobacterium sediminum]
MEKKLSSFNCRRTCYRKWKEKSVLLLAFIVMIAFIPIESFAQEIGVTGKVIDSSGDAIPGVSVVLKGTTVGTITSVDGDYSLKGIPANGTLVFSFVGMHTQELPVEGKSIINVKMVEESIGMDEVVVIGYGSMKKSDLTGSITQVKPDKVANENPNTVADLLRGKPGLSVGFSPDAKGGGDMTIRGQRSVYTDGGHNNPLIVLDGMIFYGELSEVNPDDIEQIDVLKDASAAAVYGAKSANGVIIITTKKGKKGKPKINFTASTGIVTMGANREVYGPDGYMQFYEDWYTAPTYGVNEATGNYEAYQTTRVDQPGYYSNPSSGNFSQYGVTSDQWRGYESNVSPDKGNDQIWAERLGIKDKTLDNYLQGKTYDWYDHSFRTGVNQDYNLSVSGASDNMNYYMSIGYLDNQGVAIGNDYSTIRSNLKVEGKVNSRLTIGANVNFQQRTDGDLGIDWGKQIIENSPFASYKDENGDLVVHPMNDGGYAQGYNYDYDRPYRELEKGFTVLNSIFTAKLTLPFNITYSFNASPRYQFFYDRYFESANHPDWAGTNGLVNREQSKSFDWSLNNTINWDKTFADKHHFNVTLVQEAEERQFWKDRIEARDITPSDALGFHSTRNANKDKSSFDSYDSHETADGMLGRLFYSYDERYMFTGSIRRDGYSAFGTSNPRANFYSMALAWTFANEEFINWEPLSMGKLRFSWGQNGNRSLSDPYIALANLASALGTQGYYTNDGSYDQFQVLKATRLANTNLQWEKTSAVNVGLDLGFFGNRFTGSFEYYDMSTTDMIMNQSLPNFTGFGAITCNLGEVNNKGFEIAITTHNVNNHNFTWDTSIGFSKYKNVIKHLYYTYTTTYDENGNVLSVEEDDDISNKWFIGKPISTIWDYNVTGIWQKDEVDEAARYGQRPGDPKVENRYTADDVQNEDGTMRPVYNDEDKKFLGQSAPPVNWSLRNDFTFYKNLSFSFNIYSYMGHKSLSTDYLNRLNNRSEIDNNYNVYKRKYWTIDNPSNKYGRLNASGPTGLTSPGRLFNRNFIRLENIALSYDVPSRIVKRLGMEKLKVYGNVRNVAVWAKDWNYWDPETGSIAPRTFTVGVNVVL